MAALLKRGLEAEGHRVLLSHNGTEGLEDALVQNVDAIVLDVLLPGLDGFEVARRIRQRRVQTPILMLTARDAQADKIHGLDLGADDYLTKPFLFPELLARLRAVARRGPVARAPELRVGDLVLDPATHEVSRRGRVVALTRTEFSILELLMRNTGRLLARDRILESIWPSEDSVGQSNLNAFMSTLRRKIDGHHKTKLIRNVRGLGYRIVGD